MSARKPLPVGGDLDVVIKTPAPKSLSIEDDLDVAWAKAVKTFKEESKAKYPDKVMTIGDVLANMNTQEAKQTTKTRAKAIVSNILNCVQTFGEIVAGASSAAFPPSQQCFNALNFVIVAVQSFQKIFEDLTTLLERVSVFIGTLRIYLEEKNDVKLDPRLRPVIYRVLEHFMAIMTLAVKLTNRKEKWKAGAKVFFFGGDESVTDALATLETLVSQFVQVQVAVIGQDLSEAARGIRTLENKMEEVINFELAIISSLGRQEDQERTIVNSLGRREEQEKDKNMREQLRKWLCIDDKDTWRDFHNMILSQRTENTGNWLCKEHDTFARWCDTETDESNLMIVTSDPGRGKTFLTSAVIEYLKSLASNSGGRTHVAYSYHQATAREEFGALLKKGSQQPSQGTIAISRALCNIVWQLATLDQDYRVFLFQICKDDSCKIDAGDIWDKLIIGYSPRRTSDVFIVLDGLPHVDQSLLTRMGQGVTRQTSDLHVRVFITAKPLAAPNVGYNNTTMKISLNPAPNLKEMVPSIDDVRRIIEKRLAETSIFHSETPSAKEMQQRVFDVSIRQFQNDFPRLSLVLNEISQCFNLRQVEIILERIDEPIEVNLGRQIRSLNSKLISDEIKEVNALISCLECFKTSRPGVACLLAEQYVDVKLKIPRVTPLSECIRRRYPLLFEVDALDRIRWRYPEIQQYLKKDLEDQQAMQDIYKRRGQQRSQTDLEELDLLELVIQNNLKTVFGSERGAELFDRYGLGDYFVSHRGQLIELICSDEKSNRYSVLFICLQVLCEDMGQRPVDRLRSYAREHLYQHLEWKEKHILKPEENQAIGRFLVKLLRNDTVIDHWSQEPNHGIVNCFPSNRKEDDLIWNWFAKINKPGSLADLEDQDWLSKLPKKTHKGRPSHWDYAIGRMVHGWYTQKRNTIDTIKLIADAREPDQIHRWLHTWLQDKEMKLDSNLLIKRLVQEYQRYSDRPERKNWILQRCEEVIMVYPHTWWALLYSVKVSTKDGRIAENLGEAISRLKSAMSTFMLHRDAEFRKHYWCEMLPLLARCRLLNSDLAGAMDVYSKMMDDAESRGTLNMSLIYHLMPGQISDFFRSASTKVVPNTTHHWLHELIASINSSEDVFSVKRAAHYGSDWRFIHDNIEVVLKQLNQDIDEMDHVIGIAKNTSVPTKANRVSQQKLNTQRQLRSILAYILWHESDKAEDHKKALDLWEGLEATDIVLKVLIKLSQARSWQELCRSDNDFDSRLRTVITTVWLKNQKSYSDVYTRTHFVIAGFLMNLGSQKEAQIFISKILEDKDYGEEKGSNKQLEEYGKACMILGEYQLGHDLFALMTKHDLDEHEGCERTCGKTLVGVLRPTYLCIDCMCFLKPQCFIALRKQIWIAGFCDPAHRHVALQPPVGTDARGERAVIKLVQQVGLRYGWSEGTDDQESEEQQGSVLNGQQSIKLENQQGGVSKEKQGAMLEEQHNSVLEIHGWLKGEELEERKNGVLEIPRSRASFHSIDEVTVGAQD
ncbi:hypothetical protein AG0111_0g10635 [Alternaria gaisen]|uniref:Uncharacterized protein n=1 Tax=Alternaria gaisen TaxID=167740 RepID=A0ACB6F9Z3_9PLEO|nr:hypothetical protein AG0111_0g10635 [Alternaria gaisen]